MVEKCENCHYFRRNPQDLKKGLCRKSPPVVTIIPMPQGIATVSNYPPIEADGWCGEYKVALQVQ